MQRRDFLRCLAGGVLAGIPWLRAHGSAGASTRAAAIQMTPRLGDVEANLSQAEQLLDEAIARGAEWIVLPEMFTSAAAFHQDMVRAIRPIDGAPAVLMREKARRHRVRIGGSFMAREGDRAYNSFLLFLPDGSHYRHDKDQPTYWEGCYYEGGNDDGVLKTPDGNVGVALCWEMIRSRTARRLRGRVQLLLAGSTWWTLPDTADTQHPFRRVNLEMLREAPPRLATLLGVPVIHGAHTGPFSGFDSPELPDVGYESSYLGEAMICDANGAILAQRHRQEGAGVVIANIEIPNHPRAGAVIPDRFWLPQQMPEEWKSAWNRWFPRGKDYYESVTRHYLATGELAEYLPPYLR